jgi:hypothetical protein
VSAHLAEPFDKVWLSRGNPRRALLRSWFAALDGELAEVDVELARHAELRTLFG